MTSRSPFRTKDSRSSARRLPVKDYIALHLPDRFLQSVADRMLYEYEQAYIFRLVAPGS